MPTYYVDVMQSWGIMITADDEQEARQEAMATAEVTRPDFVSADVELYDEDDEVAGAV
jgi:hypothetical protein